MRAVDLYMQCALQYKYLGVVVVFGLCDFRILYLFIHHDFLRSIGLSAMRFDSAGG